MDIVPQLHFAFAAHVEATRREWTGFLDLLYMSVGQSETHGGIPVSLGLQQGLFEFGGTYRLGPVSLGRAGRLTFEPLAGGRFIWVHGSLGFPNQKVSDSASVIDPMVGGRITYHITDTVALWFRGDVAGFGISDSQTKLTYNLIAGRRMAVPPRVRPGWLALHEHRCREGQRVEDLQCGHRDVRGRSSGSTSTSESRGPSRSAGREACWP